MANIGALSATLSLSAGPFVRGLDTAVSEIDKSGDAIRKKFGKLEADIAKTKLASTPFNINKQAGLEVSLESAQQKQQSLLKQAKLRQLVGEKGLGGAARHLLAQGGGARGAFSAAGGLSGIGGLAGSGGAAGMVGSLAKAVGVLAGPVGLAVGAVAGLGAAAYGAFRATKALGDTLASFVVKSNPAIAEKWTRVMDDMTAVIGQRMAPVLEFVTAGFRVFADFLHTILPSGAELKAALQPAFESLMALRVPLGELAANLKPIVVPALTNMVQVMNVAVAAINNIVTGLNKLIDLAGRIPGAQLAMGKAPGTGSRTLLALLGFPAQAIAMGARADAAKKAGGASAASMFADGGLKSSVGASVRQASFVSGEELSKRAIVSAFQSNSGPTEEQKQTGLLAQIAESTARAINWRKEADARRDAQAAKQGI